jgi:hypothetical protein
VDFQHSGPACQISSISRNTAFAALPDWLSRRDVQAYLGLSESSADAVIQTLPRRRFDKHVRISKIHIAPLLRGAK